MNDRMRRIYAQETRARQQRKMMNRTSFFGIVLCVVVALVASGVSGKQAQKKQPEIPEAPGVAQATIEPVATPQVAVPLPWELTIINKVNRLPKDYVVTLADIGQEKVDARIFASLTDMVAAAAADGITLTVCSGYRSVNTQDILFTRKVEAYRAEGLGNEASVVEAGKYLQPPGASEHHTGLAVDFLATDYTVLDSGFAQTDAYAWLQAHAAAYGFIERYPQGKEQETGVNWEPWHYRYVGVVHAGVLVQAGVTLEAYVATYNGNKET